MVKKFSDFKSFRILSWDGDAREFEVWIDWGTKVNLSDLERRIAALERKEGESE